MCLPPDFPEPNTPEEWAAELEHYAEVVAGLPLRRWRLLRASLNGSWCRLRFDHWEAMRAAVERVNAGLPEVYRVGYQDAHTGETIGVQREMNSLGAGAVQAWDDT